jgi:hypothetical protein
LGKNIKEHYVKFWFGLIIVLFLGISTFSIWSHFATLTTVSGLIVQGKERVVTGSGDQQSSKYLIFTDAETFENVDSWLALKFNSSDVYGSIVEGSTCEFTVTGWRIPLLSWYRNILDAKCS